MARNNFDSWVPEEFGSDVLQRVNAVSAVERFARSEPMNTDVKNVARSAGVGVEVVAKGGTYGEDTNTNDDVTLTARKFGKAIRIAEEDLADSPVNIIAAKQRDWATSYGKFLDNATLGVTANENGTTVPFTSIYNDVSANASGNLVQSGTGGVTYDHLSDVLGAYEGTDYFDDANSVVIAHPAFRASLRGIKDSQDNPVFVASAADNPDTLFGLPVAWSTGAKTSATATESPEGNPLLVVGNRDFLILGRRSGPESQLNTEASALTDEAILKMRSRRGFAAGRPEAFAVLEDES